MLRQALISVILISIFGGAIFYVAKSSKSVDENSHATTTPTVFISDEMAEKVVTITASGFFPTLVTIKEGETVTFVNKDTEGHWPASDGHPSHTIYPQFDPKKDVPPGELWSFTFTRVGTWGFHDHDYPLHRGKVTVLSKNATTTSIVTKPTKFSADCVNTSTDFDCYEEYYEHLTITKGVPAAFADLKARYEKSSYVRSQCHPLTHVIGHGAVQLYPHISEAYAHGDGFCWSGYYHGVMESIVAKIGKQAITANLKNICADVPGKERYSFDYYNCVHGLGHGLMALSNDELFDSLKKCDGLVGGWEQTSCYGGVFMENVIVDNKNHFTKYLKPAEPMYPCTAVDGVYKTSCYLMQTSYALKVSGNDFSKVFAQCSAVDAGFETTCYQSLGRDASGQSVSNVERTKASCDLGTTYEQKSNCIVGAVKDFISYHHSDVEAKVLCQSLSTDLTQICLDTTASYYASL